MSQSSTAGIDTLLEIIDAEDTEPPPAAAEHPPAAAERPPAAAEPPPAAARARKLPVFARATEMGTHGAQSRERWKATRTQRVDAQLLHLFSGPSDKHGDPRSLAHQVEYKGSERGLHLRVDEYDWVHCHCSSGSGSNRALCHPAPHEPWRTRCFNLLRGEVFDELLAYCHQGQYAAVVAGIPCHTFCVARFREDNGAKALRDKQHPFGLPHLSDSARTVVAEANELTRRALVLCAAVWERGGEVMIENPPDYSAFGLWCTSQRTGEREEKYFTESQERHCPLWALPWVQAFMEAMQARLLHFAQCRLNGGGDADFQKYTTLFVTPRWMMAAGKALSTFDNNPCRCLGKHRRQATGRDEQGNYLSARAAQYPTEMVIKIAQALLDLLAANSPPPSFAAMIGASPVQLPPVDLGSRQAEVIRLLNPQLHSIGARRACSAKTAGVPSHKGQMTLDWVFCVSTHTGDERQGQDCEARGMHL